MKRNDVIVHKDKTYHFEGYVNSIDEPFLKAKDKVIVVWLIYPGHEPGTPGYIDLVDRDDIVAKDHEHCVEQGACWQTNVPCPELEDREEVNA